MPKTIKVLVQAEVELPAKAEVIRFKDEEGVEADYIKLNGQLYRPFIDWFQYFPSHVTKKVTAGVLKSTSWSAIDDEVYNEHFSSAPEEWYMEEL